MEGVSAGEAELFYNRWCEGEDYAPKTHEIGWGSRQDGRLALEPLRKTVAELVSEVDDGSVPGPNEFDAIAAGRIHASLPLPGYIASNSDFWRFIAISEMWKLVEWRHGSPEERSVSRASIGLGDRWETMPLRLWMRADLVYCADTADPYTLSRRGGMDFWMSGLIRVVHSSSRPLARALVRFQYPREGAFRGNQYRPQTLNISAVRTLYKRLRHFHAFTAFGVLSDDDADELIESLAEDLQS